MMARGHSSTSRGRCPKRDPIVGPMGMNWQRSRGDSFHLDGNSSKGGLQTLKEELSVCLIASDNIKICGSVSISVG